MADDLKIKVTADSKQAEQDYKNFTKQIDQSSKTAFKQAAKSAKDYVDENKKGLKDLSSYLDKILKEETANTSKAEKEKIKIVNASLKEQEKLAKIHARAMAENINFDKKQTAKQNKKPQGIFGGNLEFAENLTVVTAGLAAVTGGVISLGKELFETAQAGADFGILLQSFGKAGGDETKLALLDIAAAGNLTERELISFSLQMKQVGVSVDQTTTFLRLIEQQSDNTAISFQDANTGVKSFIATGATKSLKGFLSLPELKTEVEKLNDAFVASQGELTEEQAEINRTNAIINVLNRTVGNSSDGLKDNADKVATVSSRIANFKDRLALAVSEGLIPFIDNMDDVQIKEMTEDIAGSIIAIGKFIKALSDIGKGIQDLGTFVIKYTTFWSNIKSAVQGAIDKLREFMNMQKSAQEGTKIYQFEYSTNDEVRLDKYGNPIVPPKVLAENTMFKEGRNLGETGDTGTGSNKANKEKINKAVIDGLEQQIKNLFETTLTPMESADRIKFLMGTKIAEFSAATITGSENVRNPFAISAIETDMAAQRELLLSTLSEAGNNLASIVDIFGFKVDSTLSQAVDKFQMILNLIESTLALISNINTGVSIFKTLFGIATGGGATQAGTGRMPYINPQGTSGGGSNYFKIDLNTMAIVKDGLPKYNEYKGAIAVN